MIYKQSKTESETTINYCALDNLAEIYSSDLAVIRKLDKLTEQYPDAYTCIKHDQYGKFYRTSKHYIRFAKPASEAQHAASRRNALMNLQNVRSSHENSTSTIDAEWAQKGDTP